MAAFSLASSVRSLAIARVTQPHTSSKLLAVCVRSSTVSSTRVRGGYELGLHGLDRSGRPVQADSFGSRYDMTLARNCHVNPIRPDLSASPCSSAAV